MKVSLLLRPEHVFLDVPATTREELFVYVAERLESEGMVRDAHDLVTLLLERERQDATVVGENAAIPHCRVGGLKSIVAAFARTPDAIPFDSKGDKQARLFFFLLSPREQPAAHLQVLGNIAKLLRNARARRSLADARSGDELLATIGKLEVAL